MLREQNRVFEPRGVNVRMEVARKVTGRYCDRVQGLMEITTGEKLTQVIEDTSIRFNFPQVWNIALDYRDMFYCCFF